MGTSYEIKSTRPWRTEGRDRQIIERHFIVEDEKPWEAYYAANPPLPGIGDPLPWSRKRQLGALIFGEYMFQVREIEANYAGPQHPEDSLVILRYMIGPDWSTRGNKRKAEWEHETGLSTETIYAGIRNGVAVAIPDGAQHRVPLTTIRAVLTGVNYNPNLQLWVGRVNSDWFRFWPEGRVMFVGAHTRNVVGSDPVWWPAEVILEFQARYEGWEHRQNAKDALGDPMSELTPEGQQKIVTEQTVITERFDFRRLFPDSIDPGFGTFFDSESLKNIWKAIWNL